jgi:integrase
MSRVEPIMDKKKLNEMIEYLYNKNIRDYVMFEIGINLGIRVTDFTHQKVGFYRKSCEQGFVELTPEKTQKYGKKVRVPISDELNGLITEYIKDRDDSAWMFESRNKDKDGKPLPLSRYQIYLDLNEAARAVGITDNIGCHSMRKTFGYWHYYYNHDIRLLMDIFNHSSEDVTLRYIGVSDEVKKESMKYMSIGVKSIKQ